VFVCDCDVVSVTDMNLTWKQSDARTSKSSSPGPGTSLHDPSHNVSCEWRCGQ